MHRADEILLALHERGIKVWAENGQLRMQARKGSLPRAELDELCAMKSQLLRLLQEQDLTLEEPIRARPFHGIVPLTAMQLRIWESCARQGRHLSARRCVDAVRVAGPLDVDRLRSSVDAVVRRHASLRTRFVAVDGTPRQLLDEPGCCCLEVVAAMEVGTGAADDEIRRLAGELVKQPIDLSIGPLFGARLIRLSHHDHVFVLAWDHIITDYVSMQIVSREIWHCYEQLGAGPLPIQALPLQFADYAVWQARTAGDWRRKHEAYWLQHLSGARRVQIPMPSHATGMPPLSRAVAHIPFGERLTAALSAVARRDGILLSLVVLAVYAAAVSRWCEQEDLVIWFVSDGRLRPELENVTGYVAGFLPLRIFVGPQDTFADLLRRVHAELCAATSHHDFDRVPDLLPNCSLNYESYFNWTQVPPDEERKRVEQLEVERFELLSDVSPPFIPVFRHTPVGIVAKILFRADLYNLQLIERFGDNLRRFAENVPGRIPRWS